MDKLGTIRGTRLGVWIRFGIEQRVRQKKLKW